jgi:hypothetical protein
LEPEVTDPYIFSFDEAETTLVLRGLGELPTKLSYNLVTRLAQEIAQENQRRQTPGAAAGVIGAGILPEQARDTVPVNAGGGDNAAALGEVHNSSLN